VSTSNQDRAVVVTLLEPFARLLARSDLYELVVNTPGEILTEGSDGWTRHEAPELTFDRLMRLNDDIE
jgi:type IV secretion system protein VirB11